MVALVPLLPLIGKSALALTKGSAVKMATRSLLSGAAFQAGAELVSQIGEWARSIDADWDSNVDAPANGIDGCSEVSNGYGNLQLSTSETGGWTSANVPQVTKIVSVSQPAPLGGQWIVRYTINTLDYPDGQQRDNVFSTESEAASARYRIDVVEGQCSASDGPSNPLGPQPLPPVQDGDCVHNVTFYGFMGDEGGAGKIKPVFLIEPSTSTRASGGVITGECNFAPTVLIGGGGDGDEPPFTIPNPDGEPGGDEWWKAIAKGAAQGVTSAIVSKVLNDLFNQQGEASYTLVAPCDKDEEGNPLTYTVQLPAQTWQSRVLTWQVAQADLLQQHLNWKTPTCRNDKPQLEGEWRTISFRSDQTSPYGSGRLRKRFRYRSVSGYDLGAIVDHWKDFTFTSGPVIVSHAGASWGTPKVWAATADEGKRVIRHAAGEAGIDPDQVGRWSISGSSSARYGVSDTMRVDTKGGYFWITARDGEDGRPLVAEFSHS